MRLWEPKKKASVYGYLIHFTAELLLISFAIIIPKNFIANWVPSDPPPVSVSGGPYAKIQIKGYPIEFGTNPYFYSSKNHLRLKSN